MILQAKPPLLPPAAGETERLEMRVHERMEALEAAWRALERDPSVSMHQGYDWCSAWVRAHPGLRLALVEGRAGGRTVMILPLVIARRRGSHVAGYIGSAYSNINGGLFDPAARIDPDALGNGIRQALKGRADLMVLERVPLQWRERLSPLAYLSHTENQNRAFQVPLFQSFEDTLRQVNAKRRRKKFRLQQRRLEEAGGYLVIDTLEPAEQHALLDEFFRQKAERFKAQGLPDVFADAPVRAFFHALLDAPRDDADYPLRLHALRLKEDGGPILAVTGTSRKGDHVICQFGSIRDDLLPEASPGEFLFWYVIEQACHEGASIFDFGIGDQNYKRSWCTVETVHYDVLVPITLLGHLSAGIHRLAVRAVAEIKARPRLYGALQRLRQRRTAAGASEPETGEEPA